MKLVFASLICASAFAQTLPLQFLQGGCGATAPVGTNYLLWTGPTVFPLCALIGPTLKLTSVNGHAQLDAVIPPTPPAGQVNVNIMATQLGDFAVVRATPNVLFIGPNCSAATPCNARWGDTTTQFTTNGKLTVTAGDGMAHIYLDGTISPTVVGVVLGGTLTATCTQIACNVSRGTAFPPDSIPLFTWTASAGAWDAMGGVDYRAFINSLRVVGGPGISVVCLNGTCTISAVSNQ